MSLIRCADCGDMYESTVYEGRCPHRMRHDPAPPAPTMPECLRELIRSVRDLPVDAAGRTGVVIAELQQHVSAVEAHYAKEVR